MDYGSDLINDAHLVAEVAHSAVGQLRKYTNDPYIVHPRAVLKLLVENVLDVSEEMACAALLHDVLEDTKLTKRFLVTRFGYTVANLVEELTEVEHRIKQPSEGGPQRRVGPVKNRKAQKIMEARRLAKVSSEAKTIKLADLCDNVYSIIAHDPNFSKVFLDEANYLLENSLWGSTSHRLFDMAEDFVKTGYMTLGKPAPFLARDAD